MVFNVLHLKALTASVALLKTTFSDINLNNRSVRLVTVSVWFHESGFSFLNLAVHFSSLFWFLLNVTIDLSRFWFQFRNGSQENETSPKWILWIRISETVLTNKFLFSFRFEIASKEN